MLSLDHCMTTIGSLELPPIEVKQLSTTISSEPEKQIFRSRRPTNGTSHCTPLLSSTGTSYAACTNNGSTCAIQSKLNAATTCTRSDTSGERLRARAESDTLDL